MDRLPEQHIESLTGATRREAYEKIGVNSYLAVDFARQR
jgi:hypothetical protein